MENKVREVSARQMIDDGILLEANRQFFHPLGLVLAVTHDAEDKDIDMPAKLSLSITDDLEGFEYTARDAEDMALKETKAHRFHVFSLPRQRARLKALGYSEQPLETMKPHHIRGLK